MLFPCTTAQLKHVQKIMWHVSKIMPHNIPKIIVFYYSEIGGLILKCNGLWMTGFMQKIVVSGVLTEGLFEKDSIGYG